MMELDLLTAVSPIDGRYRSKVATEAKQELWLLIFQNMRS